MAPQGRGTVHIRTQESYGNEEVRRMSWGNCFTVKVKGIKANGVVTTVEGLDEKLKHDVILSDLKKKLHCKGDKYRTEQAGDVIRLNTNRTEVVKDFLWKNGLAAKHKINCTPSV